MREASPARASRRRFAGEHRKEAPKHGLLGGGGGGGGAADKARIYELGAFFLRIQGLEAVPGFGGFAIALIYASCNVP